jgi:hypothetical protein
VSDSFLERFFWSVSEDSSRTGLPEAANEPMISRRQGLFVAQNGGGAAQQVRDAIPKVKHRGAN